MKVGDRIEMVRMSDDPHPIPRGTRGTVERVQEMNLGGRFDTQISVKWDNGRTLSVITPPDVIRPI